MEGTGANAGEIYAWAIANPDKVSVIYLWNWLPVFVVHEAVEQRARGAFLPLCSEASPTQRSFAWAHTPGWYRTAELRKITVDYTIEFARVCRDSSPAAAFSFLSGSGADPTGRSHLAFTLQRRGPKALHAAGFPRVYIFRPAYI